MGPAFSRLRTALCRIVLTGAFICCVALQAAAQQVSQSAIVTLNQDKLYRESAFGQRVRLDLDRQSADLAAENRRIEAQLVAEERRLTDERPGMDISAFRKLAADFDERVTAIRDAQEAKRTALQDLAEEERARFFQLFIPVLEELINDTGAVAILNSSAVLFSRTNVDVTDAAIARANMRLGAAAPDADSGPEPVQRPDSDAPGTGSPATSD